MRYFHNFYGIFQVSEKFGVTVGFDYGVEEKNPETSSLNAWLSPVVIVRLSLNEKASLAVRGEYYDDEHGVIIVREPLTVLRQPDSQRTLITLSYLMRCGELK
jgi:hypothetical protein